MKKLVIALTGTAVIALNGVVFYAVSAASTPKSVFPTTPPAGTGV